MCTLIFLYFKLFGENKTTINCYHWAMFQVNLSGMFNFKCKQTLGEMNIGI